MDSAAFPAAVNMADGRDAAFCTNNKKQLHYGGRLFIFLTLVLLVIPITMEAL